MLKKILPVLTCLLVLNACSSTTHTNTAAEQPVNESGRNDAWTPPAAGTTVAEYEKAIENDPLNKRSFKVQVITTDSSDQGRYMVRMEWGHNRGDRYIALPDWTGSVLLKPLLQPGSDAYHCLLGFDANDNEFHELYEIKALDGDISLKQTRGYYTER
jgi:hypothetical protein